MFDSWEHFGYFIQWLVLVVALVGLYLKAKKWSDKK